MGVTNLKIGLERKYSTWLGEKKQVDKDVAEILNAYTKLAAKQLRADQLTKLIESSEIILREIAPNWDPKKVKAKLPRDWTRSFPTGSITRWTYDILRVSDEPMTSRDIALKIAADNDCDIEDKDNVERIRQAVDAHLRKKTGVTVEKIGEYPCYWTLKKFDDRPEPMPSKP